MNNTRWYHNGANQRRDGKPCTPPPTCKDWERRQWMLGYWEKDKALKAVDSQAGAA